MGSYGWLPKRCRNQSQTKLGFGNNQRQKEYGVVKIGIGHIPDRGHTRRPANLVQSTLVGLPCLLFLRSGRTDYCVPALLVLILDLINSCWREVSVYYRFNGVSIQTETESLCAYLTNLAPKPIGVFGLESRFMPKLLARSVYQVSGISSVFACPTALITNIEIAC